MTSLMTSSRIIIIGLPVSFTEVLVSFNGCALLRYLHRLILASEPCRLPACFSLFRSISVYCVVPCSPSAGEPSALSSEKTRTQTDTQQMLHPGTCYGCPTMIRATSIIVPSVTDWTETSEVAVVLSQRSTAGRRGVHEVLVERRVSHLETDDCSDGLTTALVDHKRTASSHQRRHPASFRCWQASKTCAYFRQS